MTPIPTFLDGHGSLGTMIAARDWSRSSLGVPDLWSQPLRTALAIVLRSPLPMALLWGDDGILLYNDSYAKIAGRAHPEILGRPVAEAWPEAKEFNASVLRTCLSGETLTYARQEMTLFRNGAPEQVFFDLNYSPIPDDTGNPVGVLAVVIETTEAVRIERELLSETQTLEILNTTGAALTAELGLEPLVQMMTDAGRNLTGARYGAYFHNQMDETGERLHLFTLSGARHADFEAMGHPRATAIFGPTFRNEGVIRSADILTDPRYGHNAPHAGMPAGHLPVRSYLGVSVVSRSGEVLGGLLFGHPDPGRFDERHERLIVGVAAQAAIAIDNARLFSTVQDINASLEVRVAERTNELTRVNDALRQAQKMETLGQLTGGIAHDFNNLLQVIRGSADLLKRPGLSAERQGRYVDAIVQTADRATKLTSQLLAFARRSTLTPQIFDVGDAIRGLNDMMEMLAGALIDVDLRLPMVACHANADINQFEAAIVNMAVNARDAMGRKGRLTITVTSRDRIPPVRGHEGRPGDFVAVEITDTGTGIAPDHIDQIFEPFFTSKDVGHGTGLGLSQVFGFAKQSGGDVTVDSVLGMGATFTLYLPREHRQLDARMVDASVDRGLTSSLRILIVEDNPDVGTFAAAALIDLGHRIVLAQNADEALRHLDQPGDRFDFVFSDVMMPGMNGIDLARVIRRRIPTIPILLTSGYSDILAREGPAEFEVLRKPYSIDDLNAAFARTVLARACG